MEDDWCDLSDRHTFNRNAKVKMPESSRSCPSVSPFERIPPPTDQSDRQPVKSSSSTKRKTGSDSNSKCCNIL
ncbi:hypothetical protein PVAND_009479 [Polypedilum vanderplanki]|uniref:Uncharacterized protein n=1 Tax=Polypedilum vanderplanki TaxID=319348 RepID=A0A9J6CDP4_POLVA|nr:hypothetical protein PVAND_009479 [Polypedilum vanderplanki]